MPAYTAIVLDGAGRRQVQRAEAADEQELRASLKARALWPLQIRVAKVNSAEKRLIVPVGEFVPWLHQLELQLRAGVMADVALAQLAEDAPRGSMRTMLEHIHREVAKGRPIHEACRHFERQFPPHVAAVIAAGEAAAMLPESLHSLAEHLAANEELLRTARRALIYPVIVVTATAGLIVFLLGTVVPKFAEIFTTLHVPLPALTRFLIAASAAVRDGWPWIAAGVAIVAGLLVASFRSTRVRELRDRALLAVPVWGETIRCLATARFAAHCRLLHEAGIPLLDALATAADLVNQSVLAKNLHGAREGVALGRPLHASLPKGHAFPGFIVPALKSGETTGQLAEALRHIEVYAARRAKERIATALALLEPVTLAGLTAVVGGIALSFFLPLFSLLAGLNSR